MWCGAASRPERHCARVAATPPCKLRRASPSGRGAVLVPPIRTVTGVLIGRYYTREPCTVDRAWHTRPRWVRIHGKAEAYSMGEQRVYRMILFSMYCSQDITVITVYYVRLYYSNIIAINLNQSFLGGRQRYYSPSAFLRKRRGYAPSIEHPPAHQSVQYLCLFLRSADQRGMLVQYTSGQRRGAGGTGNGPLFVVVACCWQCHRR
jgi:hypothetical protein